MTSETRKLIPLSRDGSDDDDDDNDNNDDDNDVDKSDDRIRCETGEKSELSSSVSRSQILILATPPLFIFMSFFLT